MAEFNGVKFSDADIVNLDEFIPDGEYNPHNVRPFLLHDHGFVVCVVFADCLQNALDEAVDSWTDDTESTSVMQRYIIDVDDDGKNAEWRDYADNKADLFESEGVCALGNAGDPCDIETLGIIELPTPKQSFVAQFEATVNK